MATHPTIPFGQYRPLDSWLHRLDARAKFLPVLLVMILALLTDSIWFYLAILTLLLATSFTIGGVTGQLIRSVRPMLYMIGLTIIYHLIFTARDSEPLVTLFGFAITEGGLQQAAFFSLRLLIFVLVAYLLTLTSSPSDIAEGVTRLLRPLEKLRVPVAVIGLILFMAIRFVPILAEEFRAIRHAQLARGVTFGGSVIQRTKKSLALLLPVFVAALGRADELAIAMEARGYRADRPRTAYSHNSFGATELLFVLLSGALLLTTFWQIG